MSFPFSRPVARRTHDFLSPPPAALKKNLEKMKKNSLAKEALARGEKNACCQDVLVYMFLKTSPTVWFPPNRPVGHY
jgi:hypothetical protein